MEALQIARWVGIVFITGVIAGFGKLLASWLVSRRRKRAETHTPAGHAAPSPLAGTESGGGATTRVADDPQRKNRTKSNAKLQKKLAKAELKRRKKAGGA